MRLIVIGTARQRQAIRERLESSPPDVVAEFDSIGEARVAGIAAHAILLPPPAEPADDDAPLPERLTPREIDVLELVAEGRPNRAIAERLGISDQTVKFHLASISGKLGAANRTDAVRLGVRAGLITL
jgi:DNA-binding NarL/FixJ family response regulator